MFILVFYVQASISNHAFFLRAFPLNTNRAWMLHIPSVSLQRLFLVIKGDYHIPVFWVETFLQRGGADRGEINLSSKEDNFSCICFSICNLGWDPQNDGEKQSAFLHQKFPLSVMKENLLLKLHSKKRTLVKFSWVNCEVAVFNNHISSDLWQYLSSHALSEGYGKFTKEFSWLFQTGVRVLLWKAGKMLNKKQYQQ